MFGEFLGEFKTIRRDVWVVFLLLLNTFVWFFVTPTILNDILEGLIITSTENFIVWASYYIVSIISLIVGGVIATRIDRRRFLLFWIILGTIASITPALLDSSTFVHVVIICILFGVSFGLGVPSCLAYFADYTLVENRGKMSGVLLLITNICAPFFLIFTRNLNLTMISFVLAAWRFSGLVIFFFNPMEIAAPKRNNTSYKSLLQERSFSFYFIAWLVFYLVDRFEKPVLNGFFGNFDILVVSPIIGAFFALIAGVICDRIGRKSVILCGFAALGIGYGVLGLFPAEMFSLYFFVIIEGVASGILMVTFVLILWGDLSQTGIREKYYAIGEAPLFLTSFIQLLLASQVASIPVSNAFSLAAFFLFVAVLPLLFAPETLPQGKINLRQFKSYVEAAKKAQEKYSEKTY